MSLLTHIALQVWSYDEMIFQLATKITLLTHKVSQVWSFENINNFKNMTANLQLRNSYYCLLFY
jgi:hypothetical protein